jgi:hypothetical protein
LTDTSPFDATLMTFGFGPDERLGVLVVGTHPVKTADLIVDSA